MLELFCLIRAKLSLASGVDRQDAALSPYRDSRPICSNHTKPSGHWAGVLDDAETGILAAGSRIWQIMLAILDCHRCRALILATVCPSCDHGQLERKTRVGF